LGLALYQVGGKAVIPMQNGRIAVTHFILRPNGRTIIAVSFANRLDRFTGIYTVQYLCDQYNHAQTFFKVVSTHLLSLKCGMAFPGRDPVLIWHYAKRAVAGGDIDRSAAVYRSIVSMSRTPDGAMKPDTSSMMRAM
jgi:hypothetical protein